MSIVAQLAIGTVTVALTIIMQACFAAIAFSVDDRFTPPRTRTTRFGATLLLAASTIWMLLAITLAAWIWAGLFIVLGAFEALEPALYFATVSLTTLGFGDVILSQDVRLLSPKADVGSRASERCPYRTIGLVGLTEMDWA